MMLARKKLDISWADLRFALARCLRPPVRETVRAHVQAHWGAGNRAIASLSVRTGFDALLRVIKLPPGSEILVSAITIRDMISIIEHHGLRAASVDVSPANASISAADCERALKPNTRAILVAHLFGSRMPLDDITAFARTHNLILIEDCAQAYRADGYAGHPASDVVMFSFGTIKTATSLGGGMLLFRDAPLAEQVRSLLARYPVQRTPAFAKRILKTALLKCLSAPIAYSAFVKLCTQLGQDHDAIITSAVRGFAGGDLMKKLRHQPCAAQLALLLRRLGQRAAIHAEVQTRARCAADLQAQLPATNQVAPAALDHSYWVFPLRSHAPDAMVAFLFQNGIDATRGASSMVALASSAPTDAQALMQEMLYLPDPLVRDAGERVRMAKLIGQCNATHSRNLCRSNSASDRFNSSA
jgi:perosamine synthetase